MSRVNQNPYRSVHNCKVRFTIVIEITRGQGERTGVHGSSRNEVHRLLKRTIAFAWQDRDRIRACAGYGQVQLPVAIKVTCDHERSVASDGVVHSRLERAITVAQQDRYDARTRAHGQVELPIAVEVPGHQGKRAILHSKCGSGLEGAIAIS